MNKHLSLGKTSGRFEKLCCLTCI